jgi:hypothetical protein
MVSIRNEALVASFQILSLTQLPYWKLYPGAPDVVGAAKAFHFARAIA